MSAATRPTKPAAIHSIVSMKRSMPLRRAPTTNGSGPPFSYFSSGSAIAPRVQASCGNGGRKSRRRASATPRVPSRSVRRLVLLQRRLQFLHDRVGVAAGLLDVVGPFFLEWYCGLFPLIELRVRDRVDLVARLRLDLGDAIVLELAPGGAHFLRPIGVAVVVDHLLLRHRHRNVLVLV